MEVLKNEGDVVIFADELVVMCRKRWVTFEVEVRKLGLSLGKHWGFLLRWGIRHTIPVRVRKSRMMFGFKQMQTLWFRFSISTFLK